MPTKPSRRTVLASLAATAASLTLPAPLWRSPIPQPPRKPTTSSGPNPQPRPAFDPFP